MTISDDGAWSPSLPRSAAPLHRRLLEALTRDIGDGVLAPGARLPTHRDLAYRLGVGVGTVTRAYAEAESAGLIVSRVGRGSFVAARPAPAPAAAGPIDLANNLAPFAPAAARLRETMARLAKRPDLLDCLAYAPPEGLEGHRRAGAAWLVRSAGFADADWRRLLVCGGAQRGLNLAFDLLSRPGDVILAEAGTFFGARAAAEAGVRRFAGVAMDGEGMMPEALDAAARRTGARVVYCLPTFQNPTGRSQGLARRQAIAAVARARDLWIVEDDIYAAFAAAPVAPPLATFAPERTVYVSGVSKMLGPGLRTGYLLAPDADSFARLGRAARAASLAPPAFGALIASQWIEDGSADAIAAEVRAEIAARQALALDLLGAAVEPGAEGCPHLWAPMPEIEGERLARLALRGGVALTPPNAPIVDASLLSGVRLCLGAPADRATLARGLEVVARARAEARQAESEGVF